VVIVIGMVLSIPGSADGGEDDPEKVVQNDL
jgi:hypothetical protein